MIKCGIAREKLLEKERLSIGAQNKNNYEVTCTYGEYTFYFLGKLVKPGALVIHSL